MAVQKPAPTSTPGLLATQQTGGAVPAPAVPQTATDVTAMRIKIEDLRTQLQDFAERRNSVASQLRRADVEARPGYQDRLANLDANINLLQNQITQATLAISQAPAGAVVAGSAAPAAAMVASRVAASAVPIVFVLAIVAVTVMVGRMFSRRRYARPALAADPETKQQLERLQQAVDTIAVEVERISEGQRFVTKVLAERDQAVLPR
jgi:Flp pilus assembly protein TadB